MKRLRVALVSAGAFGFVVLLVATLVFLPSRHSLSFEVMTGCADASVSVGPSSLHFPNICRQRSEPRTAWVAHDGPYRIQINQSALRTQWTCGYVYSEWKLWDSVLVLTSGNDGVALAVAHGNEHEPCYLESRTQPSIPP